MLVFGFALQATGTLGITLSVQSWWFYVALGVSTIAFLLVRPWYVRRTFKKVAAHKVKGAVMQEQAIVQSRIFS